MEKVALVTGSSGYLGSVLCKQLKLAGWKTIGLDIKEKTNTYIDSFYQYDVRNKQQLNIIFNENKIDVVFHLAGRIEVGQSFEEPIEFYSNNVTGTISLLHAMQEASCNNIVYSSSANVYKSEDYPLLEFLETTKNSPYGYSKLVSENIIKDCKVNSVCFRYFNLAGADTEFGEDHDPETHLIPKILQSINNFKIFGDDYPTKDGTCIRDYVHVIDVADAHILAADYLLDGGKSEILNLGTGEGHSVLDIIDIIDKHTDKIPIYQVTNRREGDPAILVANADKAKKILGFTPKYNIVDIVKSAYNWNENVEKNR